MDHTWHPSQSLTPEKRGHITLMLDTGSITATLMLDEASFFPVSAARPSHPVLIQMPNPISRPRTNP